MAFPPDDAGPALWAGEGRCPEGWGAEGPLSVIILAGGRGRRFGGDKTSVRLGGETLLGRAVCRMAALSDDLIVAGGQMPHGMSAVVPRVVEDLTPYAGVMAGIAAGLSACLYTWALVIAADMPFVNLALVRYMATLRTGHDAVVPRLSVGLEPLHALYSVRCLPALHEALARGERRASSFYGPLAIRYLEEAEIARYDPEGRTFFNINTPEDLRRAEAWLREG